ncbi:PhzF family phenazine biosynthesis protein [Marinobacter sp.]|uniref:PhzF family phenazine biosynthesis protein n=1 Tax=Marinobacter sp. TaxID=50741 RepID=UPI002355F110|nr:PhzF family phenazine biosynthesis protein [Marinobacter sp.]
MAVSSGSTLPVVQVRSGLQPPPDALFRAQISFALKGLITMSRFRYSQVNVFSADPVSGHDAGVEVRAFVGVGGYEDPVTGSLNASLAQWLINDGLVEPTYIASQGTILERTGRVHLRQFSDEIWVGGQVIEVIRGEIDL